MSNQHVIAERLCPRSAEACMMADETLSEREIIEAVQNGDKDAYQVIVHRYMKTAYYIALGFVHNQQDALDISQDAFIRAFRKIKKFDIEKQFFPWFYKLMKNLCIDHIKKSFKLNEVPIEGMQIPGQEKRDPELKKIIWKGIEQLPFEQKEIIILRYFRQYSYQEIAELTQKPIGTVMSSLFYAKKKLRTLLSEPLGFEH